MLKKTEYYKYLFGTGYDTVFITKQSTSQYERISVAPGLEMLRTPDLSLISVVPKLRKLEMLIHILMSRYRI
jgi:hypothetical protein